MKAPLQKYNWQRYIWFVVTLLACVAIIAGYVLQSPAKATLRVDGASYALTIAATQQRREQGLGGRKVMAADQGMLFVFDKPQQVCMWMKDMRFSLDMLWLDEDKRVLHISNDVSPDTYPASFCADKQAKYVIELNAGEAAKHHIAVGQKLTL